MKRKPEMQGDRKRMAGYGRAKKVNDERVEREFEGERKG
jgi:hypothetical protein